ncbi:MAG: hypothetical protein PF961_06295 [Planctomycetota bacterium]|nr:hypothetical protein [Planctomycetota bacterium]
MVRPNTMAQLRDEMVQLEHLYNAFQRTGDPSYAKRARRLLKRMRKQFKQLTYDMGIGRDEFQAMLRGRFDE